LTVTGKAIVPGELELLFDHGFALLPIFQNYNDGAEYFTYSIGYDHGKQAAIRARQLGFNAGVTIFFAVDYDATGEEATTIILEYFDGVADGLNVSQFYTYNVGVYGTRNVCRIVHDSGYASGVWVSAMSTGYSGNLGFSMPENWMYSQIQEVTSINIDKNQVSIRANPATRAQVRAVPLQESGWNELFRAFAKLQVNCEWVGYLQYGMGLLETSQLTLAYLMVDTYEDIAWQFYLPVIADVVTNDHGHRNVLERLAEISASRADFSAAYQAVGGGDIAHMAATAQAVIVWAEVADNGSCDAGDLGGWGLDLVQLWVSFDKAGRPVSIAQWVNSELGGIGSAHGFGFDDVLADADGWLIGTRIRNLGVPVDEAIRDVFLSYPSPQLRIRQFLIERFGASPAVKLRAGVDGVFSGWPWIFYPVDFFLDDSPRPTEAELEELKYAFAQRFLELGGM